jgi:Secretion system C-terminal sorting domain
MLVMKTLLCRSALMTTGFLLLQLFGYSQKTWVGAGAGGAGTDFNTASNWSPSGVPVATDNVIIAITSSATITMSANASINNLTYTVAGNNRVAILSVGAFTLTVNGSATIDLVSGNANTSIQMGVNGGTSAGIIDFVGSVSIGATNVGSGAGFNGNANSKLIFRNNLTFGINAFVNITNRPGTMEFDATGTQTITWNNSNFYCEPNNVVIGNTNNPTVNQTTGTVSPDNILGSLTINGSSILNLGTSRWNGGTAGGATGNAGTLSLNSTATLRLGANTGGQTGSNFPIRFTTLTIAAGSTVEYSGTVAQTIYDIASPGYGNLTATNNSIKTAGDALDIRGNVTINSTATIDGSTFSHNVGGDWTNNGTYTQSTSTVVLNGTTAQAVGGTVSTTFNNLTLNKTAGAVTLNMPTFIAGAGTFTAGIVNSTSTNYLGFNDNATTSGANNNPTPSYVNGPVRKTGNDAFSFPVGKTGAGFRVCSISAPSSITDVFTCEFMRASGAALGTVTASGLNHVSNCEYWMLDRTTGSSSVNVSLSWNGLSNCNAAVYVNDLATLTVAHFNGTNWDAHGSSGGTTGTVSSGTVTWNGVSTFSPFAVGSTTYATNPLPVKLSNIKAYANGEKNRVEWSNLTEADMAAYYVEKSADGYTFQTIATVAARGNTSAREDYTTLDNNVMGATAWYRIRAVNKQGQIHYSLIVRVDRVNKEENKLLIYPNPVTEKQMTVQVFAVRNDKYTVRIINSGGQIVSSQTWNVQAGAASRTLELPAGLPAGMYQLQLSSNSKTLQSTFLIQ